jgi:hypothetical protein
MHVRAYERREACAKAEHDALSVIWKTRGIVVPRSVTR